MLPILSDNGLDVYKRQAKGRPRSPLDMIIAAIAEANDCAVVTENESHFAGLKIVNPLRAN